MNSKTLIGIVTFGNLPFTQLTINSIRETTKRPIDLFVVVGKPQDMETPRWLSAAKIPYIAHSENYGFPASLNDIYDYAWFGEFTGRGVFAWPEFMPSASCDHLILAGNDIVPYPGAVDALIECAETTDWEWVCSSQFDVRSLCERYPEALRHFDAGRNFAFEEWLETQNLEGTAKVFEPVSRPWELHQDFRPPSIEAHSKRDVQNLCLYKRSVLEKIGYVDVNFWPGGYFGDNDYCRRSDLAGVRGCTLPHSAYFHFWSRTIHQEGGSTMPQHFAANASYYYSKWGGDVGHEEYGVPFPGKDTPEAALNISTRAHEADRIAYWQARYK